MANFTLAQTQNRQMSERAKASDKSPYTEINDSISREYNTKYSESLDSSVESMLILQRTIGNQAVQRLFKSGVIQAKLRIGKPGDIYEQEADRVAEQIMRMPDPIVQRQAEEEEKEEELQTKPLTNQITPLVQRQVEEEEKKEEEEKEEEEPIRTKALFEQTLPVVQRQEEGEEKEEEPLQAKGRTGKTSEVTPVLESRIESLKGNGQALPKSTRSFLESRFGHDFNRVRIHTDSRAAGVASSMNARAFTLGSDIVFGAGQYALSTGEGRRLLAHELTHTIQQGKSVRDIAQRDVSPPIRVGVPSATEYREYVEHVIRMLQRSSVFRELAALDDGRVSRLLERWHTITSSALSYIRQYLGNDRRLTQRVRRAYIRSVGDLIEGAFTQLGRRPHELYAQHRAHIHAWGWPEALSEELPSAQRRLLRVVVTEIALDPSQIDEYFSTVGGRVYLAFPSGVTVRIAEGIPVVLHHGLRNTAAALLDNGLTPNGTITIVLNLHPYGGDNAAYRFTYVRPRRRRGDGRVLVERLGPVPARRLTPALRRTAEGRFRSNGFIRDGWSDEEYEMLLEALSLVSDTLLNRIQGVTFRRRERPRRRRRGRRTHGDYDVPTHVITIYDRAFTEQGLTRYGGPGQRFMSGTVASILHEIGHAIGLAPLRAAHVGLEAAEAAPSPSGRLAAARRAFRAARSASGSRWQWDRRRRAYQLSETGRGAANSAFRQALWRDGGVRVTTHPRRAWREYFAEAFFIYVTDPDTLQRLRPNVYQYFVDNFPNQ